MNSKRSFKKKLAMTIGTIGVAAAVARGGTFATFNAQTTDPGNTFATGTLVMSSKVNTNTLLASRRPQVLRIPTRRTATLRST